MCGAIASRVARSASASRTSLTLPCARYRTPPCTSLVLRLDVPAAEVLRLDERDLQPARRRVDRDAETGGAATDDDGVPQCVGAQLREEVRALDRARLERPHAEASSQRRARSTARAQVAMRAARSAAPICGSKRRSAFHSAASSSSPRHRPTARPARYAAPSAVVSVICGPDDRHAHEIGLKLHQQVGARRAAVDAQFGQRRRGVALHRHQHLGRLERDRLERRARDVRAGRGARDAEHRAAGMRIPVRCAETRKGGHEIRPRRCRAPGARAPDVRATARSARVHRAATARPRRR